MWNLVIDFIGRNWEWIAGLIGAPIGGSLITWIYNKINPDVKFGDWFAQVNERLGKWLREEIKPKVGNVLESWGKLLTSRMTGKFGKVWNIAFEKIVILVVQGGGKLIATFFIGISDIAVEGITRFVRGLEFDNK